MKYFKYYSHSTGNHSAMQLCYHHVDPQTLTHFSRRFFSKPSRGTCQFRRNFEEVDWTVIENDNAAN